MKAKLNTLDDWLTAAGKRRADLGRLLGYKQDSVVYTWKPWPPARHLVRVGEVLGVPPQEIAEVAKHLGLKRAGLAE